MLPNNILNRNNNRRTSPHSRDPIPKQLQHSHKQHLAPNPNTRHKYAPIGSNNEESLAEPKTLQRTVEGKTS